MLSPTFSSLPQLKRGQRYAAPASAIARERACPGKQLRPPTRRLRAPGLIARSRYEESCCMLRFATPNARGRTNPRSRQAATVAGKPSTYDYIHPPPAPDPSHARPYQLRPATLTGMRYEVIYT
ncbi:hypothetical protein FRC12_022575 [Ceratobasidium sp. 428]|nr:hypothetical protein FRC12_022575 [Ceratobasidium sp. 428]